MMFSWGLYFFILFILPTFLLKVTFHILCPLFPCLFLLQFFTCCCLAAQLSLTLFDPMDCNLPRSSVHGIPKQKYWSGLPFPSPGDLPDPGIKTSVSCLAGRFFTTEPPGKLIVLSYSDTQVLLCYKYCFPICSLYFKFFMQAILHPTL